MWFKIVVAMLMILLTYGTCSDFKQERAKILYYNPKYMTNVSALTTRKNRQSPYLTTIRVSTLNTIGNNVTWRFEFSSPKLSVFPVRVDFKSCDGLVKLRWLKEWLEMYSNIPINDCPVKAGHYYVRDLEFPPKNFPMPVINADYSGKLIVFATDTKERILEASVELKKT